MAPAASKCLQVAAVVPFLLTVKDNIVDVGVIGGPSMLPSLRGRGLTRDIVLVDKMSPKLSGLRKGEVVVLYSMEHRSRKVIKRITAMEGDWVERVGRKEGQSGSSYVHIPKVRRVASWPRPLRAAEVPASGSSPLECLRRVTVGWRAITATTAWTATSTDRCRWP